jgi:membrane-associated protease RseP (regulator of RpoE activity)
MSIENFLEAQLIWDESMAERAARYLEAHPDRYLVVLAGDGHVTRSGIPARFSRRSGVEAVNVLQGEPKEVAPEDADYVLVSETIELPRGGRLGVILDTTGDRLVVSDFAEDSAAKDVGILIQDRIIELEGKPIASLADLKLVLMDKRPGDVVSTKVERVRSGQATREASFSVTLR